jgi:FAD/FMN-containing dehydrogenase
MAEVVTDLIQALGSECVITGETITQRGLTGCVEGAVSRPDEIIISLERMNAITAYQLADLNLVPSNWSGEKIITVSSRIL